MSAPDAKNGGRPEDEESEHAGKFPARDYQIELLLKAVERNIIICLGTGTGKTFVSVLLIKELLYETRPDGGNRRSVFLAPTVPLVKQQAAVIKIHVDAEVGCYFGGDTVDNWQESEWRREIEKNNVLVMVPQVFSNILNQNFINLDQINLMVFDECHAATGQSCYVQIMQNHYVKMGPEKRPRILGLTASVLNKKVKTTQVRSEIRGLCSRLDSTLATSMSAMNFGTKPREMIVEYQESDAVVAFAAAASPEVGNFSAKMKTMLIEVGPHGAMKSLEHRLKAVQHLLNVSLADKSRLDGLRALLLEIETARERSTACLQRIREGEMRNPYYVLCPDPGAADTIPADDLEFSVPPKLRRLLNIFETFRDCGRELCCVVFARERYTVFALWCVLTTLSRKHPQRFGFIRPGFVMGAGNSSLKCEETKIVDFADEGFVENEGSTLENFRTGVHNVLVATSVIEEGVDVPQCNLIVRMNGDMNFRSYVQGRGRARAKPSIYAILVAATSAAKVNSDIGDFKVTEQIITRYCQEHDMDVMCESDVELALEGDPDLPTIYANPEDPLNSAIITAQSARSVLQWYCDTLGNDRFQVMRPLISYHSRPSKNQNEVESRCSILLPKASKLYPEEVYGKWLPSKPKSRVSAALATCKRLYELDELTENLVPRKRPKPGVYTWTDDQVSDEVKSLFGGHTIQQKSSIKCERAMSRELDSGKLPPLPAGASIYVFRNRLEIPLNDDHSHMRTFRPEEEALCFGLLTFASGCAFSLPDFPIFTRNGREIVRIDTIVDVTVTRELWELCTKFHAYLLKRVCRLSNFECDSDSAPAFVPVKHETIDIDLLRSIAFEEKQMFSINAVVSRKRTEESEVCSYFVREILNTEEGRKLTLEGIPKNLDFCRDVYKVKTKFKEQTSDEERALWAVPLEFFEVEFLSAPQWSKARTILTCTHRLNRLLIAEHYRQKIVETGIGYNPSQRWPPMLEDASRGAELVSPKFSSSELKFIKEVENSPGPSPADILTALTPSSAQDVVNSERFEVLGDSFLKIAVTLHLFPREDLPDEGTLTAERCRLISNMNLLKLAVPKKIHEAVESRIFSARESFRVPGMISREGNKLQLQVYKSKICADSVEAMIGVYLERSGPIGALEFLRYLGLSLSDSDSGSFLSRFDLSYDPVVGGNHDYISIRRHNDVMSRVESILGYRFKNRLYLLEAITHQSYNNRVTHSYERLEFLGDAVIDYLVSCFIFTNDPHLGPGQLTSVRSALVCNNQFAQIVTKAGLSRCLLHRSPLLFRMMTSYTEAVEIGRPCDSFIGDDETEDADLVDAPKPFGDLMESLIGAVFIDSNQDFSRTWDVFRGLMGDRVLLETLKDNPRNPIAVLEEMFPSGCEYSKAIIREDKRIEMTLTVAGRNFSAVSRKKKIAKLLLAKIALRAFSTEAKEVGDKMNLADRVAKELNLG
ncbi:endoribonuclease Dicer-like [Galendromus occidentalis]|uniref:Endoribonuclease Dicer-like n=1 Tax=Galendromus occidentalis TaxID=34638 RepID=A0AAJ6QX79_9ACAR|nr:endoribonuclease Dicer-like [Galendromus occidentalis]